MKKSIFSSWMKRGSSTIFMVVSTFFSFSQKHQMVKDSLMAMLSQDFGRDFILDPKMSVGCFNSARESYYGSTISPVNGQAHYHARLKMEGDPVLGVLKVETVVNNFRELIQRTDAHEYLKEIAVSRFWMEEVQIENTYFLVVGLD